MNPLVEKEDLEEVSAFVNELDENWVFKPTSTRKKIVEGQHNWKKKEYKAMLV